MKKKIKILLLLVLLTEIVSAQTSQITGYVKDVDSGGILPNAHVYCLSDGDGIVANTYGFFSFKPKNDSVRLMISYTGYDQLEMSFLIQNDTSIICELISNNRIGEVEVSKNRVREVVNEEVGAMKLTGKELAKIPTLFGEKDIVKALQLMPGVKMGREGNSGLYVRGGTPGQNLMLLDGIPVYNVNHMFGLFSVFTPEAVQSVKVYKGAFPAQYGGRISSVIDVKMREGNLYQTKTDVTIGTISSKILFETPVVKGKSSLLISGRRTYMDLFLSPFLNTKSNDTKSSEKIGYYFYDLNTKLFWDLNQFGRLYWSNYLGRDNYYLKTNDNYVTHNEFGQAMGEIEDTNYSYNWGNITSSLRWNKNIGTKLFVNTTFLYSAYHFNLDLIAEITQLRSDTLVSNASYNNRSEVKDFGILTDFDLFISAKNQLKFGVHLTNHSFIPNQLSVDFMNNIGENFNTSQGDLVHAVEINAYAEEKIKLFKRWNTILGFHYSNIIIENNNFYSFQPRLRSSLDFNRWSLQFSGGYMVQPVHNLINNSNMMSVNIWVPSEGNIKPSSSLQFDLGASWSFNSDFVVSVDGYWRLMENILSYKSGESFFSLYDQWYNRVIQGKGEAYGVEFIARKVQGKSTGFIGYTWSVCNQQFDELNNGDPFPFSFDRRHYLTFLFNHEFTRRFQLSVNWVLATGEPITISTTAYNGDIYYGTQDIEYDYAGVLTKKVHAPNQIIYYSSINNYRLPVYHRLDLGLDFEKQKKRGVRTWSFSAYNVYGRNNPYMVNFEANSDGELILKNATLFRFLPSVSYRYEFN